MHIYKYALRNIILFKIEDISNNKFNFNFNKSNFSYYNNILSFVNEKKQNTQNKIHRNVMIF